MEEAVADGSSDQTKCGQGLVFRTSQLDGEGLFSGATETTCGAQDIIYYLQKQDGYRQNNPSFQNTTV